MFDYGLWQRCNKFCAFLFPVKFFSMKFFILLLYGATAECPDGWKEYKTNGKCYGAFESGKGAVLHGIGAKIGQKQLSKFYEAPLRKNWQKNRAGRRPNPSVRLLAGIWHPCWTRTKRILYINKWLTVDHTIITGLGWMIYTSQAATSGSLLMGVKNQKFDFFQGWKFWYFRSLGHFGQTV